MRWSVLLGRVPSNGFIGGGKLSSSVFIIDSKMRLVPCFDVKTGVEMRRRAHVHSRKVVAKLVSRDIHDYTIVLEPRMRL